VRLVAGEPKKALVLGVLMTRIVLAVQNLASGDPEVAIMNVRIIGVKFMESLISPPRLPKRSWITSFKIFKLSK